MGKEHAKWSPVGKHIVRAEQVCHHVEPLTTSLSATASYRLHPLIIMNPEKPIPPHLAEKFANCFSPGVVKIGPNNEVENISVTFLMTMLAVNLTLFQVSIDEKGMRNDSVSREVLRHEEFADSVELKRIRDWFICKLTQKACYSTCSSSPLS